MKGILINNTNTLNGIDVNLEIIIDIPVTPPSNIVFGIKIHSSAAAEIIVPTINKINETMFLVILFLIFPIPIIPFYFISKLYQESIDL